MNIDREKYLSIGETASRSGAATSALRFYESKGLIQSLRGSGNQRHYHRAMLRRISIIRVAQTLGLSLKHCSLYNADDHVASRGAGPRFLLGDADSCE